VTDNSADPTYLDSEGSSESTEPGKQYRIVVGVDDSACARNALSWACEEARLRGAELRIVHAWSYPSWATGYFVSPVEIDQAEEWAKESLDSVLADSREQLIGLSAESILVEGPAAKVLIDESKDADLLVVGSRGRGGFSGLLLGSVSQYVAHHCSCPVVIVRNIPDHQHV